VDRYLLEKEVSVVKRGHLLWWKQELGHLLLQDVKASVINDLKRKLLTTPGRKGRSRGKATVNRHLASLSSLFTIICKQWEWFGLGDHPVRKVEREKEPRERVRYLTPEERGRLLEEAIKSSNRLIYPFVSVLLGTGCRYNEIRCIEW